MTRIGMEKTKLDHVADMLRNLVYSKATALARVLMDSWYAAQEADGFNRATGQNLLLSFETKSLGRW